MLANYYFKKNPKKNNLVKNSKYQSADSYTEFDAEVIFDNLNPDLEKLQHPNGGWVAFTYKTQKDYGKNDNSDCLSDYFKLNKWQKQFYKLVTENNNPEKVIFYKEYGTEKVRVITENPIEDIEKYSKIYINYINKNEDNYFDFLVIGEEDLDNISNKKIIRQV